MPCLGETQEAGDSVGIITEFFPPGLAHLWSRGAPANLDLMQSHRCGCPGLCFGPHRDGVVPGMHCVLPLEAHSVSGFLSGGTVDIRAG